MASENTIYFYPGQGGHSHDGENSSFIDTSKYSLFDFSWGYLGDPSRIASQTMNYNSFQNFIVETVNNAVLKPAGLILQPGTVNGDSDIISNSISTKLIAADAITANEILAGTITAIEIAAGTITATQIAAGTITASEIAADTITANQIAAGAITASEIAANTITANQIAAGAITSDELSANIVLVNNVILSNNYVAGVSGWAIDGDGTAEFANTSIRGTVQADSVSTPGVSISSGGDLLAPNFALYADGSIATASGNFGVDTGGNLYAENATIYGEINATSGSFSNVTISGDLLSGGTISSTDISGVNIDGSNITVGTRISLPIDGGQIKLGTASGGSATQVYIYAEGSQGVYIDTSGLGSSWFAGATWYINLQEFVSERYITGLNTFTGTGSTLVVNGGYVDRIASKRELKDNIQDFSDISLIDNLRPVTFIWKKSLRINRNETEEERLRRESSINIGFIAEEVEDASDGLLSVYNYNEGGEGEVEMYKYLDIIALSVANIKDLRSRVAELESRLTELEG